MIAWALRLDDTDPGVLTKFPPAVRPVTVSNVGPRPTIADPQRVGGLVDVEGPDAALVPGQDRALPGRACLQELGHVR